MDKINLTLLTDVELVLKWKRINPAFWGANAELCRVGRGMEDLSDIASKTDPLSVDYTTYKEERDALWSEAVRRGRVDIML